MKITEINILDKLQTVRMINGSRKAKIYAMVSCTADFNSLIFTSALLFRSYGLLHFRITFYLNSMNQ
jgi:hypothetical protein